jgi:hypothetical protein
MIIPSAAEEGKFDKNPLDQMYETKSSFEGVLVRKVALSSGDVCGFALAPLDSYDGRCDALALEYAHAISTERKVPGICIYEEGSV